MAKLSDIQLVLLTSAASRDDGSLFPPPDTLGDGASRIRRTITALIKLTLVEERTVSDVRKAWRAQDEQSFGVFISDAGRSAIGVEVVPVDQPVQPAVPLSTKIDTVLSMLRRDDGSTLAELVEATGWLPHTTRAALTRLRQKGHKIDKSQRNGATAYVIAAAA
jgi:hypothetical protein